MLLRSCLNVRDPVRLGLHLDEFAFDPEQSAVLSDYAPVRPVLAEVAAAIAEKIAHLGPNQV